MVVVCLSVCLVRDPHSRTEGRSKLKIDRKENEARDTGDLQPHYEVERWKRSRSSSRLTWWPKISYIFESGRPANLRLGTRMEYEDPRHRHVRWPPTWILLVAVQVAILYGAGNIAAAALLQAAQLVLFMLNRWCVYQLINQFICIRPHGSISQ